ncbi:MAG: DUF4129 domain-containing protein [Conexivisphaerales archaeon]
MRARRTVLLSASGMILVVSFSVLAFIQNAALIHYLSYSGTPLPPQQGGGSIIIEPGQSQQGSNPSLAILMIAAFLLLASFLMVWLRDRFTTSLKEMLLLLSLTFVGVLAWSILTYLLHFPSVMVNLSSIEYFIIPAVIALAIFTAIYMRGEKILTKAMPERFRKRNEIDDYMPEDIFQLIHEEKDELRRQIYICYGRLVSASHKLGIRAVEILTPREYLAGIRNSMPDIYPEAQILTSAFERARYSNRVIDEEQVSEVTTSTKRIEEKLELIADKSSDA